MNTEKNLMADIILKSWSFSTRNMYKNNMHIKLKLHDTKNNELVFKHDS